MTSLFFLATTTRLGQQLIRVIAIVEKTAGYVARNGIVFEGMVERLDHFFFGNSKATADKTVALRSRP